MFAKKIWINKIIIAKISLIQMIVADFLKRYMLMFPKKISDNHVNQRYH